MASHSQRSKAYINRQERQKMETLYRITLIDHESMTEKSDDSGHKSREGMEVHVIRLAEKHAKKSVRIEVQSKETGEWLPYGVRPAGYRPRWVRDKNTLYTIFGVGEKPQVIVPDVESEYEEAIKDTTPAPEDWDIL